MQELAGDLRHPCPLPEQLLCFLKRQGWSRHVRRTQGLWVCVQEQRLLLIDAGCVTCSYVCSTAKCGVGNIRDSYQTPVGWHMIRAKIGAGCPSGSVFSGRVWTSQIWKEGDITGADLVLSRILRLSGLEEGKNRGGEFDSWERMIYIHGTNDEGSLGQPSSKGCIRLSNHDIIDLYDQVKVGCRVLISAPD